MFQHQTTRTESAPVQEGPRVGLASYDPHDPESTFRLIEPFQLRPEPRGPGLGTWAFRVGLTWAVNLAALLVAGLVVTYVGPSDPFAYVAWAAVFGVVNAATPGAVRLLGRWSLVLLTAGVLLAVDVALVAVMTAIARPFHSPDVATISKAGAVMWAANLPLVVLYLRRPAPAGGQDLA